MHIQDIESGHLKTRDIAHASLLLFKGFKLVVVEWIDGQAYWNFSDVPAGQAEAAIQTYVNGNARGNLKKFVDAQRTIKQTLHNRGV